MKDQRPETRLVEAGRRAEWTGGIVNPPVYLQLSHRHLEPREITTLPGVFAAKRSAGLVAGLEGYDPSW